MAPPFPFPRRYFNPLVHDHSLEQIKSEKPYMCDGCGEQGFGDRYRCEQCDFDLHGDCMHGLVIPRPTMSHDFGQKATFKFSHEKLDGSTRYCDGCGKGIHGFHYYCKEKGLYLHPCCAKLEKELPIGDLKFQLRDKVSSKCIWCKKKKLKDTFSGIRGWAYVSECKEYQFHVYCGTEMVHEAWKNGSLSKDKDNDCLGLKNLKHLPIQANYRNRNCRGGNKFVRIVKAFLKTIACSLLGDHGRGRYVTSL